MASKDVQVTLHIQMITETPNIKLHAIG